jgi:sarcosine oxidase subunit gamma
MSSSYLHRHALEDQISGFDTSPGANHLSVARRPVILAVLVRSNAPNAAHAMPQIEGIDFRFCGPSQWLAVSQSVPFEAALASVQAGGMADVVDQSDAFVLMALRGHQVRDILRKAVAVDLHADVFFVGQSANTLCGQVPVNLTRIDVETFEILVPTSSAGFVLDELKDMGREFAMTVDFVSPLS